MPDALRKRSPSEVLRRGYSDEEIAHIYELGLFFFENGDIRRGEIIMTGITEVAPDFQPAWLGLSYVQLQAGNYEAATRSAQHALKVDPVSVPAMLLLVACALTTGDATAAGTYLGEIGERIDSGEVSDPDILRFYRGQLARYQAR
ncbi:MAG: hypothetical protein QY326_00510 [Bdellovibrionota bacterium]|nr:MAG: hypothetical protein QY326_00510 [Bdellovibrionota bacterium]